MKAVQLALEHFKTCQESVCSASLRQFNSGVVYQQTRRIEIVPPLYSDVGVTPVVHVSGEHDYFERGPYPEKRNMFADDLSGGKIVLHLKPSGVIIRK